MNSNIPVKWEFSILGLILAMLLLGGFAIMFTNMGNTLQTQYDNQSVDTFGAYNQSNEIINNIQTIRNSTDITQQQGFLDIIGSYFISGYAALKVSVQSLNLVSILINKAASDIPVLGYWKNIIESIIIVGIFLGLLIGLLVKGRT